MSRLAKNALDAERSGLGGTYLAGQRGGGASKCGKCGAIAGWGTSRSNLCRLIPQLCLLSLCIAIGNAPHLMYHIHRVRNIVGGDSHLSSKTRCLAKCLIWGKTDHHMGGFHATVSLLPSGNTLALKILLMLNKGASLK